MNQDTARAPALTEPLSLDVSFPRGSHQRQELPDLSDLYVLADLKRPSDAGETQVGLHLPTPARVFYQAMPLVGTLCPKVIVDVGCGQGETLIRLASWFPAAKVFGIEYDPMLHKQAQTVVQTAERCNFVQPQQIEILRGDFNQGFDPILRKSDLIYFYSQGTYDTEKIVATLARTLTVGATILEVGLVSQVGQRLPPLLAGRGLRVIQDSNRSYVRSLTVQDNSDNLPLV